MRIPQAGSRLGEPLPARYDKERSHPERDAVVLRLDGVRLNEQPLLHKLDPDTYNGSLDATVFTHMAPDNFDTTVRLSVRVPVPAESTGIWPDSPERYEVRAFRLRTPDDAREGISGGVVLCEGGILGLVHFARAEGDRFAREGLLVPLTVWAEEWPALDRLIDPLIDQNLRDAATVKRARELGVKRDNQLEIGTGSVIAGFREDVYVERGVEAHARGALEQHGSVVIVGRPKSGKTRLVWQLLRERPEAVVVIPNLDVDSSRPPGFEPSGFAGSEVVILFDDLHRMAESMDPVRWRRRFEEASGRSCLVIGTSRDGEDWKRVDKNQQRFLKELAADTRVFTSSASIRGEDQGEDLSLEEGWQLAQELGLEVTLDDLVRNFDGTPGWVLLDFDDMRQRYEDLQEKERSGVPMSRLLDSAKLLHEALQPRLSAPILRAVAGEIRGSGLISSEAWDALRHYTRDAGFGRFDDEGSLWIYRPYLEQCVSYESSPEDIEKLLPLLSEADDSAGLFYLGVYWYQKNDYQQSLACFEQVGLREDYPEAWYNMGIALGNLNRYEEAIAAYNRAIELREDYPEAWSNMGIALGNLNRYEEAVEWLCRAWRRWEQTPENRAAVAHVLRALGHHPEDCKSGEQRDKRFF